MTRSRIPNASAGSRRRDRIPLENLSDLFVPHRPCPASRVPTGPRRHWRLRDLPGDGAGLTRWGICLRIRQRLRPDPAGDSRARRSGDRQLSARRARLPRPPSARLDRTSLRQLRHRRPASRAAMGRAKHRPVRRRRPQHHRFRSVRRRVQHLHPSRVAVRGRAVPQGDRAERPLRELDGDPASGPVPRHRTGRRPGVRGGRGRAGLPASRPGHPAGRHRRRPSLCRHRPHRRPALAARGRDRDTALPTTGRDAARADRPRTAHAR